MCKWRARRVWRTYWPRKCLYYKRQYTNKRSRDGASGIVHDAAGGLRFTDARRTSALYVIAGVEDAKGLGFEALVAVRRFGGSAVQPKPAHSTEKHVISLVSGI